MIVVSATYKAAHGRRSRNSADRSQSQTTDWHAYGSRGIDKLNTHTDQNRAQTAHSAK